MTVPGTKLSQISVSGSAPVSTSTFVGVDTVGPTDLRYTLAQVQSGLEIAIVQPTSSTPAYDPSTTSILYFVDPVSGLDTNPGVMASDFTGSTSGTTLTVTAIASGTIAVGQTLYTPIQNFAQIVLGATTITALGTGTGGTGTYTISAAQAIPSQELQTSLPFKTLQRAMNVAAGWAYGGGTLGNIGGNFNLSAGVYNEGVLVPQVFGLSPNVQWAVIGQGIASTKISAPPNGLSCFFVSGPIAVTISVQQIALECGSDTGFLDLGHGATFIISSSNFTYDTTAGHPFGVAAFSVGSDSFFEIDGFLNYSVVAGGTSPSSFFNINSRGTVDINSVSIVFSGSPNLGVFAEIDGFGLLTAEGTTFSGATTSTQKYVVTNDSSIETDATNSAWPGSIAGTCDATSAIGGSLGAHQISGAPSTTNLPFPGTSSVFKDTTQPTGSGIHHYYNDAGTIVNLDSGGGGSPGGSSGQIQLNNAGAFAGFGDVTSTVIEMTDFSTDIHFWSDSNLGNIFVGPGANNSPSITGTNNAILGSGTGGGLSAGHDNTLIGQGAGTSSDVSELTAIGSNAAIAYSVGGNPQMVAVGFDAGVNLQSGTGNTFIGFECAGVASSVKTGSNNTFLGANITNTAGSIGTANPSSLVAISTGDGVLRFWVDASSNDNVVIGINTPTFANLTGGNNTLIGGGSSITTGNHNVILGKAAGAAALTNNIILANNAGTTGATFDGGVTWAYPVTTVAGLPAAGTAGRRSFVTDATLAVFASIVAGSGANGVPVYDDGTNWRIG
jgi:hypothetical protein